MEIDLTIIKTTFEKLLLSTASPNKKNNYS